MEGENTTQPQIIFFQFNFDTLKEIMKHANFKEKKVKDMMDSCGKNIYSNIQGHEEEINYKLYDLGTHVTGLKRHVISVTELFPGTVNGEPKMTTGHSHESEEIYFFKDGEGKMVLKYGNGIKEIDVREGMCVTIPPNVWHRVINTGKDILRVLCIFEKYEGRG